MLSGISAIIIITVIATLVFDFINGFHDTANAIATSVATRVLSPMQAILMASSLNFAGAFVSVKVATTIGSGIVNPKMVIPEVILAALAGAIIWNLVTWWIGIPSSSSHALIGSLIGAAIAYTNGIDSVNWLMLWEKTIKWLILSPILGFGVGYIIMLIMNWLLKPFRPQTVTKVFSKGQIASAAFMAFSHGTNDAQKSMGIITLLLVSGGVLTEFTVLPWVKIACALAMALGTSIGGWKIIKTMGVNMARLAPVNGFAAETAAAAVIQLATFMHAPVSTTHIISTAIMGVGANKRLSSVRWGVARNIVWAWILTIPICGTLSALIMYGFKALGL